MSYDQPKSHTGRNVFLGCLGGGCLVVLIGLALGAFFVYTQFRDITNLVEDNPRIEAYLPTAEAIKAVQEKAADVQQAQEKGRNVELVLSEDDINTFIAQELEKDQNTQAGAKPRIRFKIVGSLVSGSLAVPIQDQQTGRTRYFNGEADFTVAVTNGQLELYVKDVRAKGKKLPAVLNWMAESIKQENLAKDINTNPQHRDLQEKLQYCKRLEVKDGKVHVTLEFPPPDPNAPKEDPETEPAPEGEPPAE